MVNGPGPGAETSVKMLPNNKFPYVSSQEKRKKVQGSEVQGSGFRVQRFKGSEVRIQGSGPEVQG